MKSYKKIYLTAVCFILFLFFTPFPVQKTVSAHELKIDDPSYWEETIVSFNGTFQFNLFKPSKFEGQILISTYPFTAKSSNLVVEINNQTGAPLVYTIDDIEFIPGKIFISSFFKNFAIIVFEGYAENSNLLSDNFTGGSWNSQNGHCIVSAPTRENAINFLVAKKIIY